MPVTKTDHSSASPSKTCLLSFTFGLTFFILLHLLFGPIWLLLYFFRRVAIATSKHFVPGVGRILSWKDIVLVENYHERHRLSIVAMGTLRGDVSLDTLISLGRHLPEERIEGSGRLRFPELQQFQTNFLGFRFWKDDPSFHLDNHCSQVFGDDPDTPSYLKSYVGMVAELSGRAYPPRRSPWELIVVREFKEEENGELNTVVIFRAHHSLMDATSMVHLLNKFFRGRSPVVHIPEAKTLQLPDKINLSDIFLSWSVVAGFFSAFYSMLSQTAENLRVKRMTGDERRRKQQGGGGVVNKDKVNFKLSSKLPLDKVKDVAAALGVRVPSLLTTLIAANLGKVLPRGIPSINALFALPLAGHPGSLVNHGYLGQVELPLSRDENIQSAAYYYGSSINDIFLKLRFDPSILVIGYLSYVVGHCPARLVAAINSFLGYYPVTITNFAVGSNNGGFHVGGVECVDIKGCLGTPKRGTDCMIVSLGFKSHIQMFLAGNDDFLSEDDLTRIAIGIGEDFRKLLNKKSS